MFRTVLVISFVVYTNAVSCSIKICETVVCAPVTKENCPGILKTGGGYCGCCDACITVLEEGDSCVPNYLFGVTSINHCGDNLYCDPKAKVCKPKIIKQSRSYDHGPCAIKLAAVRAEQAQHIVYGLEEPHCDPVTGDFLGMQYSGSQAVCVTVNGTFISGYMVYRWLADDMDCQCARDEYAYKQSGLVGKSFSCQQNGNYATTSCSGSVCYCLDKNGKPLGTARVDIGDLGSLKC